GERGRLMRGRLGICTEGVVRPHNHPILLRDGRKASFAAGEGRGRLESAPPGGSVAAGAELSRLRPPRSPTPARAAPSRTLPVDHECSCAKRTSSSTYVKA